MKFDKHQTTAINNIYSSDKKIIVLTGGPGRGKTTILKELIHLFGNKKIYLTAPTGKAAKVMEEALNGICLINQPMTIHRLLGCQGPGVWHHDENNRLDADIVICDEASMVGSELLARIINGVSENAKLVLVGDADQLPPVPPGCPFRDLCDTDNKSIINKLIVNFRQAEGSLIADACDRVKKRKQILFGRYGQKTLGGTRYDDLFFKGIEDKELIPDIVLDTCRQWADIGMDYQVLSPQHSGVCGVENINKFMQLKLNPAGMGRREYVASAFLTLRVGDKVINKKNNYKLDIFNGYVGRIIKISDDGIVINFDGQEVMLSDRADIKNLRLAYCLTIHSSQGSEYANGVILMHSSHYFMLSNSLLYVALSRFKERLTVIGNKKGLNRAIKNVKSNNRQTYLGDVLI